MTLLDVVVGDGDTHAASPASDERDCGSGVKQYDDAKRSAASAADLDR
jgi:hypothetical protein